MLINSIPSHPGDVLQPNLINCHSALTIPAYWRAVTFLAENLTSFPRAVYRGSEKLKEHRLRRVLSRKPNGVQTAYDFWRTLFFHTIDYGNGYARVVRAAGAVSLYNLSPEDVVPFRISEATGDVEQWYHLKSADAYLPAIDVVHVHGLGFDGMMGYSPLSLHSDTLDRAKAIDQFQTVFLRKGTMVSVVVEIPGKTDEPTRTRIRDSIRTHRGVGADNLGGAIIMDDGAKLSNATTAPQDSQLIEQAGFSIRQISQIMGVPPHFLYELSGTTYNNSAEQMGLDLVRFTFRPWISNIEAELSSKLLTEAELDEEFSIKLNPNALLRGDTATQTKTVLDKVNGGLMTPNEGREYLDLPPIDGEENGKLRLPTNLVANPAKTESNAANPPA